MKKNKKKRVSFGEHSEMGIRRSLRGVERRDTGYTKEIRWYDRDLSVGPVHRRSNSKRRFFTRLFPSLLKGGVVGRYD